MTTLPLGVPHYTKSTSVSCKQLFNLAGLTVTKLQNSLDNKTVQAILCLKSWFTEDLPF